MQKKAEHSLTDAGKFPIESCRERIARKYGEDAVALSGPCEGQNLADCVCKQLKDRWARISERFAGDNNKVTKLAMMVADHFLKKDDDTQQCFIDLQAMGYQKEAAKGIAGYLKAYAMGELMAKDMNEMMDNINTPPAGNQMAAGGTMPGQMPMGNQMAQAAEPPAPPMDSLPQEQPDAGAPGGGEEMVDFDFDAGTETDDGFGGMDDGMVGEGAGMEEGMGNEMGGGEMVSIDIPKEVAQEIMDSLKSQMDIVPGEPADMQDGDGQIVNTEGEGDVGGMDMNGEEDAKACPGCAIAGDPATEENHLEEAKRHLEEFSMEESKPDMQSPETHEKHEGKEKEGFKGVENKLDEAKETDKKDEGEHHEEKSDKPDFGDKKEAASNKNIKQAQADGKQIGGKELGNAKEKAVDAPKPLSDGNVKPEGYTAGDSKFQDGKTMKNEQKFDAKEINKSDVTGGEGSLMGPDESIPKDGPKVPAGSAPIHGEEWEGGELMTKGTVIATITPRGIEVKLPNGKTLLAKASIAEATPAMIEAVKAVKFEGDGVAYAKAALRAAKASVKAKVAIAENSVTISTPFEKVSIKASVKEASKSLVESISKVKFDGDFKAFASKVQTILKEADCMPEGCTEIDTGKLEAKNFTNDNEKKADEAPAATKAPAKKEDETTYEGGKKNPENDAEKAPEPDKKAATAGTQKTAGEKPVEDPKPISDGNFHPEGYNAGDSKFQDGKTLKNEEKFDAKEINKSEVSGGEGSLMGPDESIPKDGPKVPAGSGHIKNETFEGGDVSTKGTVIAESDDNKKREAAILNEAKVREARLKVASVYVADLLRNGEITESEYSETLEKYAQMPVDAIQALIVTTKKARATATARIEAKASPARAEQRLAGISFPVIISSTNIEKSLKERLVENFKLTKKLDELDGMKSDK